MDKRLEDKKIPDDGKKKTDASAAAGNTFNIVFVNLVFHQPFIRI